MTKPSELFLLHLTIRGNIKIYINRDHIIAVEEVPESLQKEKVGKSAVHLTSGKVVIVDETSSIIRKLLFDQPIEETPSIPVPTPTPAPSQPVRRRPYAP